MLGKSQDQYRNLLLSGLAPDDFALLAPALQSFQAVLGTILFPAGEPATHAVFMEDGILSLVASSREGQRVEAGLIGREGFGPSVLAADDDRSPYEGSIQLPGWGHLVAADAFRAALNASRTLRISIQRYVHVLAMQTGFTALSNAVHTIEQRLARWILMCDDRIDSGQLALTHEFMSVMLAVRRPSVTTALHTLEGSGFIRAERGLVTVRNRAALEKFAGDAYGQPEREYDRLFGPFG